MQSRVAIIMAVVMFMLPVYLSAQSSTAGLPRPKSAADAHLLIDGRLVRGFAEEGKSFEHHAAHFFIEPIIYLVNDEDGGLKHYIDDSGLLLYYRVETDFTYLDRTIRAQLNKMAQQAAREKIVEGSLKYRINPLTMSEAWFESQTHDDLKSEVLRNDAFYEPGEMLIHFHTSPQQAEELVQGLEQGIDQLVFRYTFAGVSDNLCKVTFSGRSTQEIDLFKELAGPGREGHVTRHQTASIVSSMLASESVIARCSSPQWLVYLTDKLHSMLATRTLKMKDGWATFFKVTDLKPHDFAADVTRMTKDIRKKTSRKIIDESLAAATSKGGAWSAEGGFKTLGFGGSASFGKATAEARAAAKKDFSDIMKKTGVLGEWQGTRYIPKSIDLYTAADLRRQWGRDLTLEYVHTVAATAHHSINLTKESIYTEKPSPLCVGEGSARCWQRLSDPRSCHVWLIQPRPAEESVTWSGECVDGKVSGKGELVGRFRNDGKWETYVVEAAFRDGRLTDDPVRYWGGEVYYEGQIRNGTFHGYGTARSSNGEYYEGNWVESKYHGTGKLRLSDGSFFEGVFHADKLQHGVYTWPDGRRYQGPWKDNNLDGFGTYTWPNGIVYRGRHRNGKRNGHGIMTWPSGQRYEGDWLNNDMHGVGELKMDDGRVYRGHFRNDKYHGPGVFRWKDGGWYVGDWANGKRHGFGKQRLADGRLFIGLWIHGEFVRKSSVTTSAVVSASVSAIVAGTLFTAGLAAASN